MLGRALTRTEASNRGLHGRSVQPSAPGCDAGREYALSVQTASAIGGGGRRARAASSPGGLPVSLRAIWCLLHGAEPSAPSALMLKANWVVPSNARSIGGAGDQADGGSFLLFARCLLPPDSRAKADIPGSPGRDTGALVQPSKASPHSIIVSARPPGGSTAKPPVLCAIPAAAHPK